MTAQRKGFLHPILLGLISVGFYACSPASPKLKPEPIVLNEKVVSANNEAFRRPSVDILFVIDDSGSMDDHQENLKRNMDDFVNEFSKLKLVDYHIGVIGSTLQNDPYAYWPIISKAPGGTLSKTEFPLGSRTFYNFVTRSTPSGLNILKNNLDLGITGSGTEMFFQPIAMALSPTMQLGINKDFYRQDAYLVIIFLTDADDQSPQYDPHTMMNYLLNLKKDKNKILSYGAIIPQGELWCDREGEPLPRRLETFLGLTVNAGGNTVSLCDRQFGKKLLEFSKSIVDVVNKPIVLSRPPVVSTIKVMYGTQEISSHPDTGWSFDPIQNAIVFGPNLQLDESQPEDTGIDVSFDSAYFPEESP